MSDSGNPNPSNRSCTYDRNAVFVSYTLKYHPLKLGSSRVYVCGCMSYSVWVFLFDVRTTFRLEIFFCVETTKLFVSLHLPRPWGQTSSRIPRRWNRSYRTRGLWLWWVRTRWKLCRPSARWTSCLWTPRPAVACPVGSSANCTTETGCWPENNRNKKNWPTISKSKETVTHNYWASYYF